MRARGARPPPTAMRVTLRLKLTALGDLRKTAVKTHKDKLDEFVVTGSTSIQNTILKHTQLRNEQSKLTRLATAAGIRNTKAAETTVKARTTERTTLRRLEATKSLLETLRLASNQAERNGDNDAD